MALNGIDLATVPGDFVIIKATGGVSHARSKRRCRWGIQYISKDSVTERKTP